VIDLLGAARKTRRALGQRAFLGEPDDPAVVLSRSIVARGLEHAGRSERFEESFDHVDVGRRAHLGTVVEQPGMPYRPVNESPAQIVEVSHPDSRRTP